MRTPVLGTNLKDFLLTENMGKTEWRLFSGMKRRTVAKKPKGEIQLKIFNKCKRKPLGNPACTF